MAHLECIVCGHAEHTLLFRTRDRHYRVVGEFDVVRCINCGLVQLDPVPSEEELARYYSESYYAYQPLSNPNRWTSLKQKFNRSPIPTHNPSFSAPGDFLDIGCGSGAYLRSMLSMGWKVRGVEPSIHGVQAGRAAGFEIFHGTLLEARFPSASFDYVRSNHSFEHMPNPVEILREIHRILRPGGKAYIGVPNVDSIPFLLFGRYWWHMGAPLHVYSYSPKTLKPLLERTGFRIQAIHYNSNFEALSGSLQIFANRENQKISSDGWIFRSRALRLFGNVLERILDLFHQGDAIEVISEKPLR